MDTEVTKSDTPVPGANHPDGNANAAPSQKYIRTFAGDMEVAQKGGVPDLAPLVKSVEPPPTPAAPVAPPIPVRDEQRREETLARLRAKAEEERSRPILRPDEKPVPLPPEINSPLHTYEADFADHIKERGASQVSILAAEQDAGGSQEEAEPEESKTKKIIFVTSGIMLLLIGGGGAYIAYSKYAERNAPVALAPAVSAPIFFDQKEDVSGDGSTLLSAVVSSIGNPLPSDSVRLLLSTSATTTRESIFVHIPLAAPDILLRNIRGTDSMAGIVNVNNTQSPFFILSVSSYNETFAGMLSWESSMARNLSMLFPPYPEPIVQTPPPPVVPPVTTTTKKTASGAKAATSTPPVVVASIAPPFVPSFQDEIVANHDARVLRNEQKQTIMIYGYWNQTTLIIARDTAAFTEIVGRLANSRATP